MTKEERAARRVAREELKQKKTSERNAILAGGTAGLAMPKNIGEWGVVKTRCWVALHDKLKRQLKLKRLNYQRIKEYTDLITELPAYSADRCSQVEQGIKA